MTGPVRSCVSVRLSFLAYRTVSYRIIKSGDESNVISSFLETVPCF